MAAGAPGLAFADADACSRSALLHAHAASGVVMTLIFFKRSLPAFRPTLARETVVRGLRTKAGHHWCG
jgi:hypothetical protein